MEREEAIQVVRGLTETTYFDDRELEGLRTLIPELTESEDERIRKELIEAFEVYDIESSWNLIPVKHILAWLEKQKEQEPSWSEEDEKRVKQLIYDTEFIKAHYEKIKEKLGERFNNDLIRDCDEQIAWLKSLSSNLKKKNEDVAKLCSNEWSEEDELMILTIIQTLETLGGRGTTGMQIDWLKSLRPSWKPSEEQMKVLLVAIGDEKERGSDVVKPLRSLYYDLKKLI